MGHGVGLSRTGSQFAPSARPGGPERAPVVPSAQEEGWRNERKKEEEEKEEGGGRKARSGDGMQMLALQASQT